jgi:hypothetical protein
MHDGFVHAWTNSYPAQVGIYRIACEGRGFREMRITPTARCFVIFYNWAFGEFKVRTRCNCWFILGLIGRTGSASDQKKGKKAQNASDLLYHKVIFSNRGEG